MNYDEIIKGLSTEKVITLMAQLGADRYEEKEGYIIFPTICHNLDSQDASMKLYFYKDTKLFYCYTNCGGQSIFSFLKHYYEERQIDYDWYHDVYQVALNCSTYLSFEGFVSPKYETKIDKYRHRKPQKLTTIPEGILDVFIKTYPPEWLQEGITKEAMDKFNIRYSISQNKIIIPHYNVSGELVGIRGRALNEWEVENVGKYMPVKIEQTWYNHPLSMNLYGLNITKENIQKYGICYLFEGEKSVLLMEGFKLPNCSVAVCGNKFNIFQLKILMQFAPREIVICFDNEEKEKEEDYFNRLYSICKKYKNYCNFSFIYDREGLTKKKEAPVDGGEEVFKELLNRRVRVN